MLVAWMRVEWLHACWVNMNMGQLQRSSRECLLFRTSASSRPRGLHKTVMVVFRAHCQLCAVGNLPLI